MRRVVGLWILALVVMVPMVASAQFGGLIKKSKFDTSKVDKLLKDIDALVGEYEEASEKLWNSSEVIQGLVAQYKAGEFPVLTKNWAVLKEEFQKVKDDAEKTVLIKQKDLYRQEMAARAKAMEDFFQDPTRKADLKGKLQVPEVEQLKVAYGGVKDLPAKDKAILDRVPGLTAQIPGLLADLGKQVLEDPLKAGDYKKLIDRLNKGMERLTVIPTELGDQLKAVELLLGVFASILD